MIEPRALVMLDRRDLRGQAAIPEAALADRGVLVINASNDNPTLSERQDIQASGTLRPFDIAVVEQELGVELDDDLYTEYEEGPVILAERVSPGQGSHTQMETKGQ